MHVNVQQHRPLRNVLHDRVVVAVEPVQIPVLAQQYVGLQTVLVVRVDAGADARVASHPIARVDVQHGAHQVGAAVSHLPQLVHRLVRLRLEDGLAGEARQGGHFEDHRACAGGARLAQRLQPVALDTVLQVNL